MSEDSDYIFLISFPIIESKRVIDLFKENKIDFQIEKDDSAIKEMDAATAYFGGTFGQGVLVHFYVHPDSYENSQTLIKQFIQA